MTGAAQEATFVSARAIDAAETGAVPSSELAFASTPTLDVGYETSGDPRGQVVVLLHGFPYDVRADDVVADGLAADGARVIVPYLRGFGPTRFREEETMRSGQQGALAQDLLDLLDALDVEAGVLAGFDWGGRAACIVAALQPERVDGLVSVDGYNIQDIAHADTPTRPEWERTYWYQYYFHSARGRRGLEEYRDALCRLLWETWSPTWHEAAEAFEASAPSLHNPDFVDVVVHSYRHRSGLVDGDPRYDEIEARLAGAAEDRGADRRPRERQRRGRRSERPGRPRPVHRTVRAPPPAGHRPRRAAGGTGGLPRRGALAAALTRSDCSRASGAICC